MPFTYGCSFCKVDPNSNLIVEVYAFPEPAVIKTGSTGLKILSVVSGKQVGAETEAMSDGSPSFCGLRMFTLSSFVLTMKQIIVNDLLD